MSVNHSMKGCGCAKCEEKRAYMRRRRSQNLERIRAADAQSRAKRKEAIKERSAAYQAARPDQQRVYQARYADTHRDEIHERASRYRKDHPDRVKGWWARYSSANRDAINARSRSAYQRMSEIEMAHRNARQRSWRRAKEDARDLEQLRRMRGE